MTISELYREFKRGNFHHVNDVDEEKALSAAYCQAVVSVLSDFQSRIEIAREALETIDKDSPACFLAGCDCRKYGNIARNALDKLRGKS